MNSNTISVGLGLLGGAFGFVMGVVSMLTGVAFAITGWSIFGISSIYYAVGGLVIGAVFFVVAMLVRQKRRASA